MERKQQEDNDIYSSLHTEAIRILNYIRKPPEVSDDCLSVFTYDELHFLHTIDEWKSKAAEHCLSRYFDKFYDSFLDCLPSSNQWFTTQRLQNFEREVIGPKARLKHKKWVAFVRQCTQFDNYQSAFDESQLESKSETKVCFKCI